MEEKIRKYIASIDIGTAYSGCAFSDRKDYKRDPLNIVIVHAKGGGECDFEKTKQPSTILFNKEKRFEAFGFIAERKYAKELEKQANFKDSDWFFFKNFKMCLYENTSVSRNMIIRDKGGKEMKAMDVFAAGIKYLKDEVVDMIRQKKGDTPEKEISFVLTIPAIWNEPAKQFMIESAVKAGIPKEQLSLALEPEAAAVYCKTLWEKGIFGKNDDVVKRCMEPGGRYFVLDLGGGTIDTTVHELKANGDLIEVYKASGGPWGGCTVNTNFITYVNNLYGETALTQMRQKRPLDCYELETSFETKKRVLTDEDGVDVRLKVPDHLKLYSEKAVSTHTMEHLYINKTNFIDFFLFLCD